MNILCVLGRHQYGDPARGEGIEYGSFIPALRRLGHDVGHFDSLDLARRADLSKLNSDLLCEVDRDKPDVLLVVHHEHEIWTETLDILRCRRGPALICWTTDDSWKYREFSRFVGRHYHAMTTTYPDCVEKYHRDGIRSVLLTQWAANSEWLQSPKPASECRFPVSFVGQAYGDRAKMIDKIRKTGVDVACFGQGWPSGPIAAGDIPGIMRDSVISLSFSGIPRR
jgi:spore maturation protein CgeB